MPDPDPLSQPNALLNREIGFSNPDALMAEELRRRGYDPDNGYLARAMLERYSRALPALAEVLSLSAKPSDPRAQALNSFRDLVARFVDALTTPGATLESALGVPESEPGRGPMSLRQYARYALNTDLGKAHLARLGIGQAREWLENFSDFVNMLSGYTPAYRGALQELSERRARAMIGDLSAQRRPDISNVDWLNLYLGEY